AALRPRRFRSHLLEGDAVRRHVSVETLEGRRLLSAAGGGDVDTSFGTSGHATLDFTAPSDDKPGAVLVLPDGRFLVGHSSFASASNVSAGFSRHLANGQLDTTFGGGTGTVRTNDNWGGTSGVTA